MVPVYSLSLFLSPTLHLSLRVYVWCPGVWEREREREGERGRELTVRERRWLTVTAMKTACNNWPDRVWFQLMNARGLTVDRSVFGVLSVSMQRLACLLGREPPPPSLPPSPPTPLPPPPLRFLLMSRRWVNCSRLLSPVLWLFGKLVNRGRARMLRSENCLIQSKLTKYFVRAWSERMILQGQWKRWNEILKAV